MTLQIRQLHPLFAGEATGVDLRYLTDRAAIDEIAAALDRHAVLVFREQIIDDQSIAFSSLFGKLETPIGKIRKDRKAAPAQGTGGYFEPR
jgi:alpha-ketoglutarate-dependent 2,4-dichlorophenoxyacetate dioxygenase